MMRVYTCLMQEHDGRLVLLAALVGLAGTLVALGVLGRAKQVRGLSRGGWLLLAGMSGGSAIWCTHFVAMLAYTASPALGFQPMLTLASLVVAMLACSVSFTLAIRHRPGAPLLGGALVGLGSSAMHYLGMAAFGAGGVLAYDALLVFLSVLLAAAFSMAALHRTLRLQGWRGWLEGGLLFSLGIVGLHFTGMGAILVLPGPLASPASGADQAPLALAVGLVALMVASAAAAAWLIDHRSEEVGLRRMRRLADGAIEGLAVVRHGRIVEANASLQAMTGLSREALLGRSLPGDLLPALDLPEGAASGRVETRLSRADGSLIDVEVVVRDNAPLPGKRVFAVRDLRERRAQEQRLRYLTRHDGLTGLPNRFSFVRQLTRALGEAARNGQSLAVIQLGLNRFKEINDLYGHTAGDAMLRDFARRLGQARPDQGLIARLGGDEFGLLHPYAQRREVEALTRRLEALALPAGGTPRAPSFAIGIALFPGDGADAETLLANADLAMRRAKATQFGAACFYEAGMDAMVRERLRLADDLRQAVGRRQLRLFYQRQASTLGRCLVGHEALLRWDHPEHGLLLPKRFIPLAEESELILALGDWALRTACAEAVAEPRLGKVAVNLSPAQFRQADLPGQVTAALEASGLPAARLELEITESTLMQDPARTVETLLQMKRLGISIAIDDFGTGHSSLATLRAFPFDKIKLDRSFIPEIENDPQARAILRAVLGIGRGLGIPVLAEGVETEAQLTTLGDEGCAEVQGYLLGQPCPLSALSLPAGQTAAA
ncbi:MAG TPA: EAL domain-containing protein [Roseomonas sp.]|nr:EAL domain-containing protein [Roseomonas sp.]